MKPFDTAFKEKPNAQQLEFFAAPLLEIAVHRGALLTRRSRTGGAHARAWACILLLLELCTQICIRANLQFGT